ncbi:MAG: hypothetical protein WKF71_18770 [Pyrinomonadaceae bacterium]
MGKLTQPVYDSIRAQVPFIEKDEYMKNYIDSVKQFVHDKEKWI